ncbi:MAG: YCF48-related protein [Parvularculales bacterium]
MVSVKNLYLTLSLVVVGLVATGLVMTGPSVLISQALAQPQPTGHALQSDLATRTLLLDAARSGDRLVAVGEHGHVVYSDDNGKTWTQASSVPTQVTLTSVTFPGGQTGYAAGHDTTILKTVDGGDTWTLLHNSPSSDAPVLTLYFEDENNGLAMGAFSLVLETKDGGRTWTERSLTGDPYDDLHLNGAFGARDGSIYVAAEFGTVYKSSDGGATFQTIQTPYEGSFWGGMGLPDGGVLVHGMRGNAYRTDDNGRSWKHIPTGAPLSFASATQLSNGTIVMTGLSGAVAYSEDGGHSFRTYIRPDRLGYSAVLEGADGNIVLFGEPGVVPESASFPDGATGGRAAGAP